jgi:hypothetical protein
LKFSLEMLVAVKMEALHKNKFKLLLNNFKKEHLKIL